MKRKIQYFITVAVLLGGAILIGENHPGVWGYIASCFFGSLITFISFAVLRMSSEPLGKEYYENRIDGLLSRIDEDDKIKNTLEQELEKREEQLELKQAIINQLEILVPEEEAV